MSGLDKAILHVDMDAFFASIEQVDNPELKGKPVIVGGKNRGVVSTASYEARVFGIRSAMPSFEAKKLCPHGIFLPVRMERYAEVSASIMEILQDFSPLVEKTSIDEAYVDLSGTKRLYGNYLQAAFQIKEAVLVKTGLTCSIGIAPGKFLAKIASDWKKPNGLMVISPDAVAALLKELPVDKLPGIGPKSKISLASLGVNVVADILQIPESSLQKHFGRYSVKLKNMARGVDESPVIPFSPCKSLGSEDTLPTDTNSIEFLRDKLLSLAERLGHRLRSRGLNARSVILKLKYSDFQSITRSHSLPAATCATKIIFDTAFKLLSGCRLDRRVRLIGISVSRLEKGREPFLFPEMNAGDKWELLDNAVDTICGKFGPQVISRGKAAKSLKP